MNSDQNFQRKFHLKNDTVKEKAAQKNPLFYLL